MLVSIQDVIPDRRLYTRYVVWRTEECAEQEAWDATRGKNIEQCKSTRWAYLFRFRNGCLAAEDVTNGSIPKTSGSPHRKRPNFVFAGYPRAQLPSTKLALDVGKASNDLVQLWAFCGILLDHGGDEWIHKLEPIIFLVGMDKKGFSTRDGHADLHKTFSN
jgi:hypothetical protein